MATDRRVGPAPSLFRRLAPWSVFLLLATLLVGVLPSAFAESGGTAAEAISVGSDGRFSGSAAAKKSVWYRFGYTGDNREAKVTVTYLPDDANHTEFYFYTGTAQEPRKESSSATREDNTLTMSFVDPGARDVFVEVVNDNDEPITFVGAITPSEARTTPTNPTATPTPGPVANSAQDAVTVGGDGNFSGTISPQRAVWYRFWYGNPGADASVKFAVAPGDADANLTLYTGAPNDLKAEDTTATRDGDTLTQRIRKATAQWVYFSIANNNSGTGAAIAYLGTVAPSFAPPGTPTPTPTTTATATPTSPAQPTPQVPAPPAPAMIHDQRYFPDTGFRIDNDAFWNYFQSRGGVNIFGLPVSREFTLDGFRVQVFQRQVMQLGPNNSVRLLNLLDPEIFPYTRVNGSTFPSADEALKNATPRVGDPNYGSAIVQFVRTNAPNSYAGQPVRFGDTFFSAVTPAVAGTSDENILALLNLEIWGAPISQPMRDPNNADFIYQRFQRGIMHYRAGQQVTEGILLADYLKSILLGPGLVGRYGTTLPVDLADQARDSRYMSEYCPGATGWLCRPGALPNTDLTYAFERG